MERFERLTKEYSIYVADGHEIMTDTILLASFSMPKNNEICADFGTGCGAIAMLWAARSKAEKIYGIEIQENVALMAKRSVKENSLENKIEIIEGDIKNAKNYFSDINLVACNPPYKEIGRGIKSSKENELTARHEISCSLDDVAKSASKVLRFGGRLCICQKAERLPDAISAMKKYGIEPKRLRLVQQNKNKKPYLFLLEGRLGGKPFMEIEKTLFIEENGNLTEEMIEIYGDYKEGCCK